MNENKMCSQKLLIKKIKADLSNNFNFFESAFISTFFRKLCFKRFNQRVLFFSIQLLISLPYFCQRYFRLRHCPDYKL